MHFAWQCPPPADPTQPTLRCSTTLTCSPFLGHRELEFHRVKAHGAVGTAEPDMSERKMEQGLLENLRELILELGKGFAFPGSQYHLEIGDKDCVTQPALIAAGLSALITGTPANDRAIFKR